MVAAPGLYVHVPFCRRVCPYCDFAVTRGSESQRQSYLAALSLELDQWRTGQGLSSAVARPTAAPVAPIDDTPSAAACSLIDTIYFGGGTPSFLRAEELQQIVAQIRLSFPVAERCHIFMEANPEDVSVTSCEEWRELGITHLSLGVQSFDDSELQFLGRGHTGVQSRSSIEIAAAAGFDWVSFDLIYGLPEQQLKTWLRTLELAASLQSQHLSCYQLTIHEGTPFEKQRQRGHWLECPEPRQAELFAGTHRHLEQLGLHGYEVSNFSRGNCHRSRHNQKYWHHVPYWGLGPSAHSFCGNKRWWNVRSQRQYAQRLHAGMSAVEEVEELVASELLLESVMLGLRTSDGIDLRHLEQQFGVDLLAQNREFVNQEIDGGRVSLQGSRLCMTQAGLAVVDGWVTRLQLQ